MTLLDRIREEIESRGPMPFDRFMELALYDAESGFFGSGPLRSTKSGDFLTSPEVSPWFGRTLAKAVGAPRTLIEVGAGSGSLIAPLVEALPNRPQRIVAVDASPAARLALADHGFETAERLAEVGGPVHGAIVANELLDNLPMRIGTRAGQGWMERWIGLDRDQLVMVEGPARPDTVEWLEAYAGPVPEGGVVEVQLEAAAWLTSAIEMIHEGKVIVIDYGATAEELAPRRSIGTLRTYRAHHLGPDPLLEPGATDITADVNFTALADIASATGAEVRLMRQDDFLVAHGLRSVMDDLRRRELELARGDDAMARLAVRSELRDAETLLHPRGLGDFRVLVVEIS